MLLKSRIFKHVFSNGLTVLVLPKHQIPKVSLQLWYDVGSKDEKSGEKGIAHFIEHMIFKGTTTLSESDINSIVNKLSGYTNAFTSYDYTGYLFDVPSQHWQEVLPILADCMRNCTFKEELLNSELKAVIQELKMYRDHYFSSLLEQMISAIFTDHPYHHPIIGYKADLWALKREALVNFYNHHYIPNNATLVVVGDVHVEQVLEAVQKNFGHLAPNPEYKKQTFYHEIDIKATQTILYRDIKQPLIVIGWVIPGVRSGKEYIFDLTSLILGAGKGSRLQAKLIDELELVTELESFVDDLFEYSLFGIYFEPRNIEDIDKIIGIINEELMQLSQELVSDFELNRAIKKVEVDLLSVTENNQKLAYLLGKFYLALKDEQYLLTYANYPKERLKEEIQSLIKNYMRPSVMHTGKILPLADSEKHYWVLQQQQSDLYDAKVLGAIIRQSTIEEVAHAAHIKINPPAPFKFPQPQFFNLSNGLKVFYHSTPELPKVELILDLKTKHYYDPEDKLGLGMFIADLLQEGTSQFSATELAQEIEAYGMELKTFPGHISLSMLSQDLEKGLDLLYQILTDSSFEEYAIEKIRTKILADLIQFWDDPSQFTGQLSREAVYKKHPYAKNLLGTIPTVESLSAEEIRKAYKHYITPYGSRLAVVGDLSHYNTKTVIEKALGKWSGPQVPDLYYPALPPVKEEALNFPINRDQVVLCYGGISVGRKDKDYDTLLLFDQIFTGGVLGGMNSRLFQLREQSGLFYTIGGSLLAGVNLQPGMVFIKTIVSLDRLSEAEKQIEQLIDQGAQNINEGELEEARNALINSFVDYFATNKQIASTFLSLDQFGLPFDYFNTRAEQLNKISLEEIKKIIPYYLSSDRLIKIRVGRV